MMRKLLIFLLLSPFSLSAQITITGKVIDANSKPVPFANVFLSNTQVGTQTKDDGSFALSNVKPGQYDMVVSFIGYQTNHQNINAGNTGISLPPIVLALSNKQLKEVRIGPPDPNRKNYLELFTREFLGRSENAADCKILNPDVLDLDYDGAKRTLTASSDDFLIIENKALGYKIHYQLTSFILTMQPGTSSTYYYGNVLFENMQGSRSQVKKWEKKRLETYLGSGMHFLRSIIANRLDTDGFKVLRLIRKPNPNRPPDEVIRARIRQFSQPVNGINNIKYPDTGYGPFADSLKYWREKFNMPKIFEYLVNKPLLPADFVQRADARNLYALTFTDYLYIVYPKKTSRPAKDIQLHPKEEVNYTATTVTLPKKFAVFDQNGIFIDPTSTLFEGEWGKSGNADLLPVDYMSPLTP
ncbi:carboxypeptidase-like regulatory domain-containing protein [Mucilaginibacter sp. AW1-3]